VNVVVGGAVDVVGGAVDVVGGAVDVVGGAVDVVGGAVDVVGGAVDVVGCVGVVGGGVIGGVGVIIGGDGFIIIIVLSRLIILSPVCLTLTAAKFTIFVIKFWTPCAPPPNKQLCRASCWSSCLITTWDLPVETDIFWASVFSCVFTFAVAAAV
jgi:hypothetical protein